MGNSLQNVLGGLWAFVRADTPSSGVRAVVEGILAVLLAFGPIGLAAWAWYYGVIGPWAYWAVVVGVFVFGPLLCEWLTDTAMAVCQAKRWPALACMVVLMAVLSWDIGAWAGLAVWAAWQGAQVRQEAAAALPEAVLPVPVVAESVTVASSAAPAVVAETVPSTSAVWPVLAVKPSLPISPRSDMSSHTLPTDAELTNEIESAFGMGDEDDGEPEPADTEPVENDRQEPVPEIEARMATGRAAKMPVAMPEDISDDQLAEDEAMDRAWCAEHSEDSMRPTGTICNFDEQVKARILTDKRSLKKLRKRWTKAKRSGGL